MREWKVAVGIGIVCCCCLALADVKPAAGPIDTPKSAVAVPQAQAMRPQAGPISAAPSNIEAHPDRAADATVELAGAPSQLEAAQPATAVQETDAAVSEEVPANVSGPRKQDGGQAQASAQPGIPSRADNTCQQATTVAACSTTLVTLDSTAIDANDPDPSCYTGAEVRPPGSVWFKVVPQKTSIHIDTCAMAPTPPDEADTVLALWSGTCGALTEVACSDDDCGEFGFQSTLDATVTVGQTYYISVARYANQYAGSLGDYLLYVDACQSCVVNCTSQFKEGEFGPLDAAMGPINNGCLQPDLPAFAEISCNQTICGKSAKDSTNSDSDWYRLWLPAPATISVQLAAEFPPKFQILQPGSPVPCTGYTVLASYDDPNYAIGDPNCPVVSITTGGQVAAGAYWVVVEPGSTASIVPNGADYSVTVTTTPCNAPTGACCVGTTCSIVDEAADCELAPPNGLGGVYWGDGSTCGSITCFPGCTGTNENETTTCFNGYTDTINSGCGYSDTAPPLMSVLITGTLPQTRTYCGKSGTHYNNADPNLATENRRDNDYYAIGLGGTVGTPYEVRATLDAEFPYELILVGFDDANNPCGTLRFDKTAIAPAGVQSTISWCYPKLNAPPYRDMWIIVRPYIRGGPREIPCGLRYKLTVTIDACTTPGACCTPAGCVEGQTWVQCEGQGNDFLGEGSVCAGQCCPCAPGNTPENEATCGYQYGTTYDTWNGGCWTSYATPANQPVIALPIAENQHYCGDFGSILPGDGSYYLDADYYLINLAQTTDLTLNAFVRDTEAGYFLWTPLPNYPSCGPDPQILYFPNANIIPCQWFSLELTNIAAGWHIFGLFPEINSIETPGVCWQYEFYIDFGDPKGSCCVESDCQLLTAADCTTAGGTYGGDGTDCDPNPCCEVDCVGVAENEPNCTPQVNGGCWQSADPNAPLFGNQLTTSGVTVCGTVNLDDGDWYTYNHPGGDLQWIVSAEFAARLLILIPPCASTMSGWQLFTPADCAAHTLWIGNPPAGTYYMVVNVDAANGPVTCPSEYSAQVLSFFTGACCVDLACSQETEAECTALGGLYGGNNTTCDPNPCCEVDCVGTAENEPNCGLPTDTVNGGCNSTPPVFGNQLNASGAVVCGTAAFDGSSRDTDWFTYNHPGGDLKWCVTAEFPALLLVLDADCNNLMGWQVTIPADCTEHCLWIASSAIPAGPYYLFVGVDWDQISEVACGAEYGGKVLSGQGGACCLPVDPNDPESGACQEMLQVECTAAGGTFTAGITCDPNPCCEVTCDTFASAENEANCGLPTDTTNGGCNETPIVFGAQLNASGAAVCGTVALVTDPNTGSSTRDLDWYTYNHTGGDMVWFAATEFVGQLFILGPVVPGNPCDPNNLDGYVIPYPANCGFIGYYLTPVDAPVGQYLIVMAPDWNQGDISCVGQSFYEIQIASGVVGACCFDADCAQTYEDICTTNGGTWEGDGVGCVPSPCGPAVCRGDCNCDGNIGFADIDFFVAGIPNNEAAWAAKFPPPGPTCSFANCDVNGDGNVAFSDIDPFVAKIPSVCP